MDEKLFEATLFLLAFLIFLVYTGVVCIWLLIKRVLNYLKRRGI